MKRILIIFFTCLALTATGQKSEDIKAIKALTGYYRVTFDYSETFAPDTTYKFHPKYHSYGYEWVFVAEETPEKIVLQHILAMDTLVIKHWREDWTYENLDLLSFKQDDSWSKIKLRAGQAKKTWTQKVYQVDDSPRYESYGTWIHADGRHFWISETDSPLPRREYTKRNDYNVLHRRNFVYLTSDGWMFEQDNQKIIRSESGDQLLAWEKGFEKFEKTDGAKFKHAEAWWEAQKSYWAIVRELWSDILSSKQQIALEKKIEGKRLYERLFELGDETAKKSTGPDKKVIIDSILKYVKN